jgi:hypothetical protein
VKRKDRFDLAAFRAVGSLWWVTGAGVRCPQGQMTQVLRRLTPAREINT